MNVRHRSSAEGTSGAHVDVVKNEWLAGYQVVVARVREAETGPEVDAGEPAWREFVLRFVDEAGDSSQLGLLHDKMRGDYVFATEPHDEAACPFNGGLLIPLVAVDSPTHAAV